MIRKRIGLLLPSMNTTLEPDFYRWVPDTVSVHSHRLWAPPRPTQEDMDGPTRLGRMNESIAQGVEFLTTAQVDVIVYGCTSGSFSFGPAGDKSIQQAIEEQAGRPAVVATGAVKEALTAVGAKVLSVVSPYPEATNQRLKTYLMANGYSVASIGSDPIGSQGSHEMVNEDPHDIRQFALAQFHSGSDALLCPCTAWRALEAASDLESNLGVPVITSNLAIIWQTLAVLTEEPRSRSLRLLSAATPA